MLDLHYHVLPGVDDGPATLEESLGIARLSARDGVTHIVATPHCYRELRLFRDFIMPRVAAFNGELKQAEIPITVLPGSEIQVSDVAEYRRDFEARRFCHLGDNPAFTLLEFPWNPTRFPDGAAELVEWLGKKGTTPIIPHPERQDCFRDHPDRLDQLVEAGAWIQITVDSLLGNFGTEALETGAAMLGRYRLAILASDSHGYHRCSGISGGYEWVRENIGIDREQDLMNRSRQILDRLLEDSASA